ncbi:MAG: hybrid sensor histidine kinase/response regulator [Ignavibacteriaceae bacterium]
MPEKIFSKYALEALLEIENIALAIGDADQKIVWFNKKFKRTTGAKKIKGQRISNLFNISVPDNFSNKNSSRTISFPLYSIKQNLNLSALKSKVKLDGYLLSLEPLESEQTEEKTSEMLKGNFLFQKEMHEILALLLKEKSLNNLADMILKRCASLTGSDFGLIYLINDNGKTEYIYFDPKGQIKTSKEFERSVTVNFSFINKWFDVNKRSLLVKNLPDNIGYNLAESLHCSSLIISPCLFDDKLLASIIVGKNKGDYNSFEFGSVEQFALLLAFAITSIRARELNAALEGRLLQAQKLEIIGKLSSGMAHDFNNLLSSIFGSLNLLKKRVPEREDLTRLLENIENCSIRAKDLTKGLLSFGKPTPKRKELIKPNFLLSEISTVIQETFPKRIVFKHEAEKNLYDILGNGTEIYQVLLNLCVNAKEAIERNGEIILRAKNISIGEDNLIHYPLLSKGNYVWISVSDSGAGIDEENLTKIFDPYFSTKGKESSSGSGLGLYVTYGIVKAHNGHIEVSSAVNKGTTFDVFIPAYEPAKLAKTIQAEKIILLADDEIMLRDLLSELLESYGYNVIKVGSGFEVLKVLTEEIKVDLAIIDFNMPGMNGLDCIRNIRELNFTFPVILSSGSLSMNDNFEYQKFGANSMLPKPYEFDTMLETIRKLI